MGEVISIKDWKEQKNIPISNAEAQMHDDQTEFALCPTCRAPAVKQENGKLEFDEDKFIDMVYEESRKSIENIEDKASDVSKRIDLIDSLTSRNDELLEESLTKLENDRASVILYNLHNRLKNASEDDPIWAELENVGK